MRLPPETSCQPIDRTIFRTELVSIGAFRCAREHPRFTDSGPIGGHCFVFPRSAVTIEHEHVAPFVANPNVVTVYNRGQRYLRSAISPEGDRSDWFGVAGELACEVTGRSDPAAEPDRPFRFPRGISDAALYLAQRRVHELVASRAAVDPLAIEELVVLLLERVVELSSAQAPRVPRRARGRRDLVRDVEQLLSERPTDALRLTEIAREVGSSVYHLCREFRSQTGMTMHQYRHQLRLRSSLELLHRTDRPLVRIALDLGFSSHSHFSNAFRRGFGLSPSRLRATASRDRARGLGAAPGGPSTHPGVARWRAGLLP